MKPVVLPHYSVDLDVDLNLIPSALRSRILQEREEKLASQTEGVLVEIETGPEDENIDTQTVSPNNVVDDLLEVNTKDTTLVGFDDSPTGSELPEPLQPEKVTKQLT